MTRSADDEFERRLPQRVLPGVVVSVDRAACTAMVRLPTVDSIPHGPAPYTPIVTGTACPGLTANHPSRGTRCLVLEDVQDGLWVSQWALSS